ncbi:uncharacterized protein TNCV_474081 [Trichonephila clavipes]|nr:uncharacterized protein TNCV_474081 [Trichonephila clavipes]
MGRIVPLTRASPHPYTVTICPQNKPGFITKHNFCQSVTFHIDLAWHHCKRSCRCSGVERSARKRRLNLGFALQGAWKLFVEQLLRLRYARIVERVTVGSTIACRMILRYSSSWSSWSLQTRFSAREYLLVSNAPNNF